MKPNPEPKPTVVEPLVGRFSLALLAIMPFIASKLAGTAFVVGGSALVR